MEQAEKVSVTKMERCRRQKDNGVGTIGQRGTKVKGACVRVPHIVGFVDDQQIELDAKLGPGDDELGRAHHLERGNRAEREAPAKSTRLVDESPEPRSIKLL